MLIFKGKSVSKSIAMGKIQVFKNTSQQVDNNKIEDTGAELTRLRNAISKAIEQLRILKENTVKEIGESGASIFEMHQLLLQDKGYVDAIEDLIIARSVNAAYAIASVSHELYNKFSQMEDDYMRGRGDDIKDISQRLIQILNGSHGELKKLQEPVILVTEDLVPSQTVQLDKENIMAFVTVKGSLHSHTAILARTMDIPTLVGTPVPLDDTIDGKMAVIDGENGILYVEPNEEIVMEMKEKQRINEEAQALLLPLRGKENITLDGRKIKIHANVGNSRDLTTALSNDAEGIGLFRSEFLYLEKENYPTEDEQFAVYKTLAVTMGSKPVTIRTMDIGADKQADYFQLPAEVNPAMGFRAIRICLTRPDLFKTQLRAIFRAGAYGNISVMYPMIISVDEVIQIKEIVKEVKRELDEQGIQYGDIKQGIMIETPAAVMMSDELAEEVDFFSIGTNDLTQYTLAIDRQNNQLDAFFDTHHPAILRMVKLVVDNAHKAGISVGICGELGADTSLTGEFIKMGVDELSVSPVYILPLRKTVLETDINRL
mgnify:CR=1 FL=1